MDQFNTLADEQARERARESQEIYQAQYLPAGRRPAERGRAAIWQARLVLLVMINIAQLWILSATVEAALAGHYRHLIPLVVASAVCWLIALTIVLWWKPASSRRTSTGYIRDEHGRN
jgi:hypothetical protein